MLLYSAFTVFSIVKFSGVFYETERQNPQVVLPTPCAQYLEYSHRSVIATDGQVPFNGTVHQFPLPPGEDTNVVDRRFTRWTLLLHSFR